MTVYYLGPPGSFSHQASKQICNTRRIACSSLQEIFMKLKKNKNAKALLPLENTVGGTVKSTIDNLLSFDLKIQGEIYLPISHNCLSRAKNLRQIQKVFSHPQALLQCSAWLDINLPNAKRIGLSSTAEAARSASKDKSSAALASTESAKLYDLNILACHTEDYPANTTRFVVLENILTISKKDDKFACYFTLKHEPGSLERALKAFSKEKLNLSKLESQPLPDRNFEYGFYLELEGNLKSIKVNRALKSLKKNVTSFVLLGSFVNQAKEYSYIKGLLIAISEKFEERYNCKLVLPSENKFSDLNQAMRTRFALMSFVARIKKEENLPILDLKREEIVTKTRLLNLGKNTLSLKFLSLLLSLSKKAQNKKSKKHSYTLNELRNLISLLDHIFDIFLLNFSSEERRRYLEEFIRLNK